jgi:4-diphosphocytidyl-2-C-methyl-D-erythritol kinase
MTSIKLAAPAKVNLLLKILGKRKDSYHNIFTIFERISLRDFVKITKISKSVAVSSDRTITHSAAENLAYKAARLILSRKKVKSGVRIEIKKNIPIGGGLGGGSSDAAAVLVGIDRLLNLKLKKKELMCLAKRLGADVPFFISDAPFAVGTSRGDRLMPIHSRTRFWHLLIYPGFRTSTKDIYKLYDTIFTKRRAGAHLPDFALTKGKSDVKIRLLLGRTADFSAVEEMIYNDLEEAVKVKKSIIGRIIKSLASNIGKRAIVSGSGSSLFCLYSTRKEAMKGKEKFLRMVPPRVRKGWRVFVVKTES